MPPGPTPKGESNLNLSRSSSSAPRLPSSEDKWSRIEDIRSYFGIGNIDVQLAARKSDLIFVHWFIVGDLRRSKVDVRRLSSTPTASSIFRGWDGIYSEPSTPLKRCRRQESSAKWVNTSTVPGRPPSARPHAPVRWPTARSFKFKGDRQAPDAGPTHVTNPPCMAAIASGRALVSHKICGCMDHKYNRSRVRGKRKRRRPTTGDCWLSTADSCHGPQRAKQRERKHGGTCLRAGSRTLPNSHRKFQLRDGFEQGVNLGGGI
ncbi:hypothetical protein DFH07DRAFT_944138 [Mycena maculata]|uniref:Uncharacterized protein n=1 Tax=Mycena maculata TaxID=230809 RepID=A0AAD7IBC8_9AGAR|nr:hypothetical protein DFH07DRAFT_944138 [Mycena maculata]